MSDIFDEISPNKGDVFDEVAQLQSFGSTVASGPQKKRRRIESPGIDVYGPQDWPALKKSDFAYTKQIEGAATRGWMQLGHATLTLPAVTVRQVGFLRQAGLAEQVLHEQDPERKQHLIKRMSESKKVFNSLADELGTTAKLHKEGQKIVEENHPEWGSNPPESFVDLVTHPDKLGIAIAESTPVLVGAGILTAAGQPKLAVSLMYVTEGSQAQEQALQNGASEEDAAIAYGLYGSVSAALESMQLEGFFKIAKGSYNALLNRTVQKVASKGLKAATMETIKVAAQEALEEMSQGAWQEFIAKTTYGKDVPGGVSAFIDRRAQEAYTAFMMGLIPGVAGGITGAIQTKGGITTTVGGGAQVEQQPAINVYKTTSGSRTGIQEQDIVREGERYIDKVTGEDVVFDTEASGSALEQPVGAQPVQAEQQQSVLPEVQKEVDQYDALLAKVQEGDKRAAGKLTNLVQGFDRPTYDELLERVQDGNQHAMELIEAGFYQGGKPFGVAQQQAAPIGAQTATTQPTTQVEQQPEQSKLPRMSRKKALKLGHDIPDILGWDEAQRRDFMQQTVGKPSMKNMTPKEMKTLVAALQGKIREAGLEYIPKELPVKKLVATLEQNKKPTEVSQIEELNRGRVRKAIHRIKSAAYSFVTGMERMERFCESLDGHKEGTFTNEVWKPIKQKDELSTENANNRHKEFLDFTKEQGIDNGKWLSKKQTIDGVKAKLTSFQKIGVYLQSQNKHGMKQLVDGVGFTQDEVSKVNDSLTEQEQEVADWLSNKYEEQWPVLQQAAAQAGMDLTALKKEFRYAPIIRLDSELDAQEDFLSAISDAFKAESTTLEKEGIIQKRKSGAYGKIELDAAIQYLHNANRVERFIQFAPEAKRLSGIFNNRQFKEVLNNRTYGQGAKLFNKWVKDSIRGSINDDTTFIIKMVAAMRRNGIIYAIGYNIPSSFRQILSLSNAVAVDPLMLKYTPVNLAKASNPFSYKKLEQFVYDHSLTVKHASFDRDLSTKMNKYALEAKIKGKQVWSRRAVRWIRWMDRHTRVVAWKSLYDVGMDKFNDETKAIDYADKWIGRTQPMADMKDLPHFFRGGTFEKLLTTFQNQINNNGNFYVYDILGAKKSGEIGYTKAAYRVMFSYVLPAMLFGMIGRARLPKTIGEVVTDLVTYPIASLVVVGRWITAMIQGWESGNIAEATPAEASKFVSAVKRKDLEKIIKYAITTIGAVTGRIPAQAVRTVEGAKDLYQGETEDYRRLIYSERALQENKKENNYTGGYVL